MAIGKEYLEAYTIGCNADMMDTREGRMISSLAFIVAELLLKVEMLEGQIGDLRGEMDGPEKEWK